MMTPLMLTGQTDGHLVTLGHSSARGSHRLQPQAADAFSAMQQAARFSGFDLQPASSFRDFDRQLAIWNGKFSGQRPLLDKDSRPLDALALDEGSRIHAILHWSALPGASRHHWGSDLDIYDPGRLPADQALRLEPAEYLPGGYFADLSAWLDQHMAVYGFYRPYGHYRGGVAIEPWHLSYRPLSQLAERLLTPAMLLASWQQVEVAGAGWVAPRLTQLFQQYISNVDKE